MTMILKDCSFAKTWPLWFTFIADGVHAHTLCACVYFTCDDRVGGAEMLHALNAVQIVEPNNGLSEKVSVTEVTHNAFGVDF